MYYIYGISVSSLLIESTDSTDSMIISKAILEEDTSSIINTQCHNQVPLVVTASLLGLVSLFLLVVAIIAGIYISYRLCKCDKKLIRYVRNVNIIGIS